MGYLDGTQMLTAAARREIPRLVASHGHVVGDLIGATGDKIYTDSSTVKSVQQQLYKLSVATSTPTLDPGTIDGLTGPHTSAAVAVFNTKYGWPTDGGNITAGTLEALKRPDVVDPAGYAAQQASLAGDAARTPADLQAATVKLMAAVSPDNQADAQAAHALALTATTPAQMQAAKDKMKAVAEKQASANDTPWGTIALLGGLSIIALGGLLVMLKKGGSKSSNVSRALARRPASHYRTLYASRSRR